MTLVSKSMSLVACQVSGQLVSQVSEGATDRENNAKLLHELAMVFELKDRSAQFHTTLVVASPNKESLVVEADWPGYINFEPKGENGLVTILSSLWERQASPQLN